MIPPPPLAELTTLRLGARPARYVDTCTEDGSRRRRVQADEGQPLLVLGGGSNVVVADEGFAGVVLRDLRREVVVEDAEHRVARCAHPGLRRHPVGRRGGASRSTRDGSGSSALSGIPGSTGATPVQNVGAYGQEASAGRLGRAGVGPR